MEPDLALPGPTNVMVAAVGAPGAGVGAPWQTSPEHGGGGVAGAGKPPPTRASYRAWLPAVSWATSGSRARKNTSSPLGVAFSNHDGYDEPPLEIRARQPPRVAH